MEDMVPIGDIDFIGDINPLMFLKNVEVKGVEMLPTGISFAVEIPQGWVTHVPGWGFPDDSTAPREDPGNLLFTVWAGFFIEDRWRASGFIQKFDMSAAGNNIMAIAPDKGINNWQANWAYDGRWGLLANHQPVAGEFMLLFLTAGNGRFSTNGGIKAERSNIVLVQIAEDGLGVFPFSSAPPVPLPPTPPDPTVLTKGEQAILGALDQLDSKWTSILNSVVQHEVEMGNQVTSMYDALLQIVGLLKTIKDRQDRAYESSGPIKIVLSPRG